MPALIAQAEPLIADQHYAEATTILEEAALVHPDTSMPLNLIGQIYLTQHRWLLAEDAFNRALARQPDNVQAIAGLAEVKYHQGDWVHALNLWQKAVQLDPLLPGVFTGLGRIYLDRLDFDAAKKAFLDQQNHQADPEAQWHLAALEAPFDVSAAHDYLRAIPPEALPEVLARRDYLLATLVPFTDQSPTAEVARAVGIALVQAGHWPLAVHALRQAEAKTEDRESPRYGETLAFLAHALAQAGHPAFDLFEQAQTLNPQSALPLYFYGIYLRRQNALEAAGQAFMRALSLEPDNAAIHLELAHTYAEQGKYDSAEAEYEAAIVLANDPLPMQMARIRFYAGRGYKVEEAGIPAAEEIIKANTENADVYNWLGWMQLLAGEPKQAEDSLRKALELDARLVSAHFYLARSLEIDTPEEALAQYQRVVDLDTSGTFRDQALEAIQRLKAQDSN